MEKELTPKQQTSEAVRQAETILILTGQHPSVDQVASTIALANILRKFGKKVNAVISDEIPAGAKFLPTNLVDSQLGGLRDFIVGVDLAKAEVDKIKYTIDGGKLNVHISPFTGGFKPADVSFDYGEYQYDIVIVLGVASYSRIDRVYAQSLNQLSQTPLINIDFHRSNEQYGAINLIEPSAAGLGEILVALSESLQTGLIDTPIATAILAGIYAATDRFTATHTTSKALTVAAQMVSVGADQQLVVRGLYRDGAAKRQSAPAAQPKKSERSESVSFQPSQPEIAAAPRPVSNPRPINQAESVELSSDTTPRPQEPVDRPQAHRDPDQLEVTHSQPDPEEDQNSEPPRPIPQAVQPVQPLPPLETPTQPDPADQTPSPAPQAPSLQELVRAPLDGGDSHQPGHSEYDSDGPAVTDPDEQSAEESAATSRDERSGSQPEPLINDTTEPRPAKQPSAKNPNPTNNPVFANRLS